MAWRQQPSKGVARLLSKTIGPGGRGGFRTPVNRHSFLQKIKMPSAGLFKATITAKIILVFWKKELFYFLFFIYVSFWSESRWTQPRRGCVDRGKSSYLVLGKEGGGERNTIDRAALRVVDYVDSSMWYVPLWKRLDLSCRAIPWEHLCLKENGGKTLLRPFSGLDSCVLAYCGSAAPLEGYWCCRTWVQWSFHCTHGTWVADFMLRGAKCGLIASNEREV